jgi:hypothetical protein
VGDATVIVAALSAFGTLVLEAEDLEPSMNGGQPDQPGRQGNVGDEAKRQVRGARDSMGATKCQVTVKNGGYAVAR